MIMGSSISSIIKLEEEEIGSLWRLKGTCNISVTTLSYKKGKIGFNKPKKISGSEYLHQKTCRTGSVQVGAEKISYDHLGKTHIKNFYSTEKLHGCAKICIFSVSGQKGTSMPVARGLHNSEPYSDSAEENYSQE
jgi:hypothetical protein